MSMVRMRGNAIEKLLIVFLVALLVTMRHLGCRVCCIIALMGQIQEMCIAISVMSLLIVLYS